MTTNAPPMRWQVFPDLATVAEAAATMILAAARASHGAFHLVLAGGSTPEAVYERLRNAEAGWGRWQIYFGDERCLPPGDPGRNDMMARCAWLDRVPMPRQNIHSIPAELGAQDAAAEYAETVRRVPEFDFVLLGLGEDGHTASLFPGNPRGWRQSGPEVVAVREAPKPPAERVSLSAARLSRARQVVFMVSGESKRDAVQAWRAGADIPARYIAPAVGVDVFVDCAAWPET